MASTSSSSSITTRSSTYEVFLSFRGEDTRNSFISYLYRTLKQSGVNVFLDSKSLWTGESIGETLLAAIQGSKISIPVFSERYADSKWCLMELAEIVECQNSIGQFVLPIFFNVDPSNVRNQKEGNFAKAFEDHEKNFKTDIVIGWRDALKKVGGLKGEVVNDTTDQGELIESVVERVMGELSSKTHLAESKYLTGIDSPVNELLSLLDLNSNDVQFVGISGIGGIGKTTIAKNVYNRIMSTFKGHSFISDVREHATQSTCLVSLQKQLLKDILQINIDISNHHRGKTLIEHRLCKKKVLIVLDDVDSPEQVGSLVGQANWLGQGSRVILTTRDEDILNDVKIYRPEVLNHNQSLQLFSLHAFGEKLPPDNYMQLSNDMASYSGGLPLTLEVLGSSLSNANIEEWESTLQRLKEIPPEKVQQRLRISYDKLEECYQKEIFLDAASFFIGWEKEEIISIWEACGYYPRSAIRILTKRSLIKFENSSGECLLKMHDQVRDMGRGIVLGENRTDPSERSRLWSCDDILQVLESNEGTSKVRGLVTKFGFSDFYLHEHHFNMMPKLKFLDIKLESAVENSLSLPRTLRWFHWRDCPLEVIPTTFYHKGLVHLKLSGHNIRQAWNTEPQDENKFQKLKVLDLNSCHFLSESPNFSWFPYLEQLDLSKCGYLEILDESIGQLSQLKSFRLEGCYRIIELPNSIGSLKSLVKLNLSGTRIKELPDSLRKLSFLKNLKLIECLTVKKLPNFIGDLKNLVELDLCLDSWKHAEGIEELPEGVGLLENLEVLNASGRGRLVKLPRSMGRMKCLHTLNLVGTNISELPDDFLMLSNLEVLKISYNLKSFDLIQLKKLRELTLVDCKLLEELPEVVSSLVELSCQGCNSLERTFDMSRLKNLKVLQFWFCEKLKEIQGLDGAESLESFGVGRCPNMTNGNGKRTVYGQGTLLRFEEEESLRQKKHYRLWATTRSSSSSKGIILCFVFRAPKWLAQRKRREGYLSIFATIHQRDKAIECSNTLDFTGIERISRGRDMICLHHFEGFDWFGIPLQGKDSIVIRSVNATCSGFEVIFWELLLEEEEEWEAAAGLQKPIDPARTLADFFIWDDSVSEAEEESMSRPRNNYYDKPSVFSPRSISYWKK